MGTTGDMVPTAEKREFNCPYCTKQEFKSVNPDTILLHVISKHSEKSSQFKKEYLNNMVGIFRRSQRCVYVVATYLTAMFIILGLVCFYTWLKSDIFEVIGWSWIEPPKAVNPRTLQVVIFSLCAGGIGSITYCLWALVEHHCRFHDFDTVWAVWYFSGPISGSIVGIATYAVVVGGLFVLGNDITLRSNWSLFAFSFLAGFAERKVLRKLFAIAGQIFQEAPEVAEGKKQEKKEGKDRELASQEKPPEEAPS